MKKINIIVLLVAIVSIGVGLMLSSGKRQTEIASDSLFPELQKHINDVTSIRVSNANGVLFDATLVDGSWGAADKANYPLDQEKIIRLLNGLVKAKLDSAKTAKPENHARLGLQDINAEDSQAQLLELNTGMRSWQLLVGNKAASGNGLFVRKTSEDQTWLTKTQLTLPSDSHDWLKSQILDLTADELVSVSREGHWTAVVASNSNAENEEADTSVVWTLENMPEGRELNYESIVKNTVDDILELEVEELVQQKPYDFADEQPQSQISLNTKEKATITISLYQSGEDNLVVYENEGGESHWNNWVFKVSQFQAGHLMKELESFLQDLPEEPKEKQEEANP